MAAGSLATSIQVELRGAGGERVGFRGTVGSHGLAWLPPNDVGLDESSLTTTLLLSNGIARTVALAETDPGILTIAVPGRVPSRKHAAEIEMQISSMFALGDDLAALHARLKSDPELSFAPAGGLGRMLRSPTAFEDVVRTIWTTNCAWSATERMISALVEHLGVRTASAPESGWHGRAFPTAQALAEASDSFYRDVMRAGYRGPYFKALAELELTGTIDVEAWRAAPRSDLSDAELEELLRRIPGVGPYAAAHIMMLFGRASRLILDSWTRPRYAELRGRKKIADRTIERHFKAYGDHAGAAFWLFLWKTRHTGTEALV